MTAPSFHVLLIEDDRLIINVLSASLTSKGYSVAVASHGLEGLQMIGMRRPDVILLDFMLPGMNGLEILQSIRAHPDHGKIPVVVLSNSASGDTMHKLQAAGASRVLPKAATPPKEVIHMIEELVKPGRFVNTATTATDDDIFQQELKHACLSEGANQIATMRKSLLELQRDGNNPKPLDDLYRQVHAQGGNCGLAGLGTIARFCTALEHLLKGLVEKPGHINRSILRTMAQAVDCLNALYAAGNDIDKRVPAAFQVLVVDDQDVAQRAIVFSLAKVNIKPVTVNSAAAALEASNTTRFNLIISDIQMPDMNGLELCGKIRESSTNAKTPVVFITSQSDFSSQANAILKGGNDLIAKPFHYAELGVKALIWLMRPLAQEATPGSQ
jgi:CheY-like chemotaxis protein